MGGIGRLTNQPRGLREKVVPCFVPPMTANPRNRRFEMTYYQVMKKRSNVFDLRV